MAKRFHELKIAGCTRQLPIMNISDTKAIAAFVVLGDVELAEKCAEALLERSVPLVEIYTEERQEALRRFLDDEAENGCLPVPIRIAAFRNITVQVCHDRWAIITKENAPCVSFLSRIPQMIDALERFNMR